MATKKTAGKAAAGSATKPALTAGSLNRLIRPLLGQEKPDARATKLSRNWRALIAGELSISVIQAENLRSIPADEVAKVQRAFKHVVTHGGEFKAKLGEGKSEGSLIINMTGTGATLRTFKITILTCTFDANCRNWRCHLGPAR